MCWGIYKSFQLHFYYKNIIYHKWEINLSIAARKKKKKELQSRSYTDALQGVQELLFWRRNKKLL